MDEKPLGIALVVCDQIMTESVSNKCTLVGVCNKLFAARFPCVHHALCVYALMTNGRGRLDLKVRCSRMDGGAECASADAVVDFLSPSEVMEAKFVLRNLQFSEPGWYCIELICAHEIISETRLLLQSVSNRSLTGS